MTKSLHTVSKSNDPGRVIKLTLVIVMSVIAIPRSTPWFAGAQVLPHDPVPTCTDMTNAAPGLDSWFQSNYASKDGVVNPANSVTFPNITDCSFYQWSWQMFLWLTSPAPSNYGGGGRIFESPVFYDVSPLDQDENRTLIPRVPGRMRTLNLRAAKLGLHGLPIIMDKRGRAFEIERPKLARSGKQLILDWLGRSIEIERAVIENGKPVFRNKAGTAIHGARPILRPQLSKTLTVQKFIVGGTPIFLNSAGNVVEVQPGQTDGGILMAQNKSLVYYAMMVNDVFAYFATGIRNNGIPSPGNPPNINNVRFPRTQADLNVITAFAASHGKTFPDPNALAIEIKSSWIEAAGLPNLSSYITMTATIPTYDRNDNQWIFKGEKTALLALVGMHVVGSTKGHPEMIFATFEHFGNVPNASYSYNSTNGPKQVPPPPNLAGPWLFSATNSPGPFNDMHMKTNPGTSDIVSKAPFSISPSDTMRMKPWGAPSTDVIRNTDIISINTSILQMMGIEASGDVRNNYFLVGATWTINGQPPSPGNQIGTNKLCNATMETYVQGNDGTSNNGMNCFDCHGTNTVNVSHIFCTPNTNCVNGIKALF